MKKLLTTIFVISSFALGNDCDVFNYQLQEAIKSLEKLKPIKGLPSDYNKSKQSIKNLIFEIIEQKVDCDKSVKGEE